MVAAEIKNNFMEISDMAEEDVHPDRYPCKSPREVSTIFGVSALNGEALGLNGGEGEEREGENGTLEGGQGKGQEEGEERREGKEEGDVKGIKSGEKGEEGKVEEEKGEEGKKEEEKRGISLQDPTNSTSKCDKIDPSVSASSVRSLRAAMTHPRAGRRLVPAVSAIAFATPPCACEVTLTLILTLTLNLTLTSYV